jgi:glutaredoxin-like protein NrdH
MDQGWPLSIRGFKFLSGGFMREKLEYTKVDGRRAEPQIVVFSLSTCGFCKRAMTFLENQGFAYQYIHLDKVPLDQKTSVKKELQENFNTAVAFPFVLINDKDTLVGFVEADWKARFGIS